MTDNPTPLQVQRLQRELMDTGVISRLEVTETTTSTNHELLTDATQPGFVNRWPHFSVLTAEEQTAGRGRLGRGWSSPRGASLSTSVVLRSSLPQAQRPWFTLVAGYALVTILREEHGLAAGLKWPNDVLIDGRKIAGLLAVLPAEDSGAVILGCGINVLQGADELPTEHSTSLRAELAASGQQTPKAHSTEAAALRTDLLVAWLSRFRHLHETAEATGGIAALRADIVTAISTLGTRVRVELPDQTAARGTAVGVDDDGGLIVEVTERRRTRLDPEAGGGPQDLWEPVPAAVQHFTAADVIHLRSSRAHS
ncbi:biotin--[acetyl-CoA-carboxylase] ligase [Nesterenkonia alba]|uniref:biotin--[acetyl-CoA-carboxylase] ligase n=1 Tax=Nesterenkonia alba TaxID=515814 RepID=UPI0003B76828|nr:biotin--[acetyl-CoA-carboxylase] ligase [Nesterenkonia alba]